MAWYAKLAVVGGIMWFVSILPYAATAQGSWEYRVLRGLLIAGVAMLAVAAVGWLAD